MSTPLVLHYPVKPFQINQKFGECNPTVCDKYKAMGLAGHNGEDLQAPDGWLVRAAHDGVVTFAGEDGSGGLGVVIRTLEKHTYGVGEAFYKTIFWHLKVGTIYVHASQVVSVGDILACADNTGLSTGSHLHFGLKPLYQGEQDWQWINAEQNNGYLGAVNPAPFWSGMYAQDYANIVSQIKAIRIKLQALMKAWGLLH